MNWCGCNYKDKICGFAVCSCGHAYFYHHFINKDCKTTLTKFDDDNNELTVYYCKCKKFEFLNNDVCTLECQILFLIETNK